MHFVLAAVPSGATDYDRDGGQGVGEPERERRGEGRKGVELVSTNLSVCDRRRS